MAGRDFRDEFCFILEPKYELTNLGILHTKNENFAQPNMKEWFRVKASPVFQDSVQPIAACWIGWDLRKHMWNNYKKKRNYVSFQSIYFELVIWYQLSMNNYQKVDKNPLSGGRSSVAVPIPVDSVR